MKIKVLTRRSAKLTDNSKFSKGGLRHRRRDALVI